jgi:hypothetical protein
MMFPLQRLQQCGSTLRMDNIHPHHLRGSSSGGQVDVTLLKPYQLCAKSIAEDVPQLFDTNTLHSINHPNSKWRIPISLEGICSGS